MSRSCIESLCVRMYGWALNIAICRCIESLYMSRSYIESLCEDVRLGPELHTESLYMSL
jgi:hypothetical protein